VLWFFFGSCGCWWFIGLLGYWYWVIGVFGYLGIWVFGYLGIWVFGFLGFWVVWWCGVFLLVVFFGVCWIELLVEIVILGVVLVGVSLICGYGVVVGTWMKWGCWVWLGDQGRLAWLELGPGDLHRSLVWKPRTGGFAREFWLWSMFWEDLTEGAGFF